MDIAEDIKEFLMTRRARIRPEQMGLPSGRRRRVPGLRREEVAQLAGVSTEYYTQIGRAALRACRTTCCMPCRVRCDSPMTRRPIFFDLVRAAIDTRTVGRPKRDAGPTIPDGV